MKQNLQDLGIAPERVKEIYKQHGSATEGMDYATLSPIEANPATFAMAEEMANKNSAMIRRIQKKYRPPYLFG